MKEDIYKFFSEVQTGVITDVMNLLGIEGWLEDIFPLKRNKRIFGKAFTVRASYHKSSEDKNYTIYDLADKWQYRDVLVIDGLDERCSLMGENMAHVCMYWGLNGVVLNGRCRDSVEISELEIPVFCKGAAMKLRGGILNYSEYNVPLNIKGANIMPGDYVLGDGDGVLVIPENRLEEIKYQAEHILEVEKEMEFAIKNKHPICDIKKIIEKKKILRK